MNATVAFQQKQARFWRKVEKDAVSKGDAFRVTMAARYAAEHERLAKSWIQVLTTGHPY